MDVNNVLRPIFQQTVGLLSGHRAKGKLLVLTYHRVLEDYDEIIDDIDAVQFTQQMETLSQYFNVMSLEEGLNQVRTGDIAPGAVCITFDDGYRDNYDVALPILNALDIPATFFVATGYLGDGRMWNDIVVESVKRTRLTDLDLTSLSLDKYAVTSTQQKLTLIGVLINRWRNQSLDERNQLALKLSQIAQVEFSERIMMNEDEIKKLSDAGMEIGGHTVNHPILASTSAEDARYEIEQGKAHLENITGKQLRYFAYPSGRVEKDYRQEHKEIVEQAGFTAALTMNSGAIDQNANMYELPRISIDYTSKFKFGASLARGFVQYAN